MSFTQTYAFNKYLGDCARAVRRNPGMKLDLGPYAAFAPTGRKGGSPRPAGMAVYQALLSDVQLKADDKGRLDRGVWTGEDVLAVCTGYSTDTVGDALAWLVKNAIIFEWRSPRQDGDTAGYCVPDLLADRAELEAWEKAEYERLGELYRGDHDFPTDPECDGNVRAKAEAKARVAQAKAAFVAAHPGHHAFDCQTLALLTGKEPIVGVTLKEANAGMAAIKATIVKTLGDRGVQDPEGVLKTFLEERKAQRPSAAVLRRLLDNGAFERYMPTMVDDRPSPVDADEPGYAPAPAVADIASALVAHAAGATASAVVEPAVVEEPVVVEAEVVEAEFDDEGDTSFADEVVVEAEVVEAPELVVVPTAVKGAPRVDLHALRARDGWMLAHRTPVTELADALGVHTSIAGPILHEAVLTWVVENTNPSTGEEPSTEEVNRAIPGIAAGLLTPAAAA